MLRRRKTLGLAVTARSATAVEVVAANGGGRASRAALFVFPEGQGLDDPVALGKALKRFLRQHGFSASRCVVGVEAARLTARARPLPPAAGESAARILALMVEREFASDRKELVFDYSLAGEGADHPSALLVASPRSMLEQVTALAGSAGLRLVGVTGSTLALAAASEPAGQADQIILHLFAGGAELALRGPGGIAMMRRLPIAPPAGEALAGAWSNGKMLAELVEQLRRVVALLPGAAGAAGRRLLIWDETGLPPADREALARRLSLPVGACDRPAGLAGAADRPAGGAQYSAAAAMALSAVRGEPPAIDLLHSRLAPRKRLGIGRPAAWAAAVLAALAVAAAVLALDWRSDRREVAELSARRGDLAAERAEAQDVVNRVTFARSWFDRRPAYLDCIREITLAFPQEGTIWTTSLAVQEDMKVVLSGQAVGESAVLDVLDRLKANPRLSEVKPLYLRQAGRGKREVDFAMSFTFIQSGKTWSSADGKESSSRSR